MSERWKGWLVGYIAGAFIALIISAIESFWIEALICLPIIIIAMAYADGWSLNLQKTDEKFTWENER